MLASSFLFGEVPLGGIVLSGYGYGSIGKIGIILSYYLTRRTRTTAHSQLIHMLGASVPLVRYIPNPQGSRASCTATPGHPTGWLHQCPGRCTHLNMVSIVR